MSKPSTERYSILVVPRFSSSVRRFEISRRWLHLLSLVAAASTVAFIAAVVGLVHYRQAFIATTDVRLEAASFQKERAALIAKIAHVGAAVERTDRLAARLKSAGVGSGAEVPGVGPIEPSDWLHAVRERPRLTTLGLDEALWRAPSTVDLAKLESTITKWNSRTEAAESVLHQAFAHQQDQLFLWSALPTIWPVHGWVTSEFGDRRVVHGGSRWHEGIDIAGPRGTPVIASGDGFVTYAGYRQGYGLALIIDHGYGVTTLYGHCSQLRVREGARVRRGDLIATVGSTGFSTGPHLHYEVHVDGVAIDPLHYIVEHFKTPA